jgi:hypothetical protein
MNIGVNYMREHVVQEARVHYVVEDGGVQPNVVPPYARSWYYVRAPRRDLVEKYYQRLLKMADGADQMAETTHKVEFLTGVHNGVPNRPLAEAIVANMREIGAPTYTEEEYAFAARLAGRSCPAPWSWRTSTWTRTSTTPSGRRGRGEGAPRTSRTSHGTAPHSSSAPPTSSWAPRATAGSTSRSGG